MKKIISYVLIIIGIITLSGCINEEIKSIGKPNCAAQIEEIKLKLDNADFCTEDKDCVWLFVGGGPFKCHYMVNRNIFDELSTEVNNYCNACDKSTVKCPSTCPNPIPPDLECQNNKCEVCTDEACIEEYTKRM